MLAKKFRLRIQSQTTKQTRKSGIQQKNRYFIIKIIPNNFSYSRFGAIINRKVNKKATQRNRIKRIIFNFVRLNKLHQVPRKDILIIALPPINRLTQTEIQQELNKLLNYGQLIPRNFIPPSF